MVCLLVGTEAGAVPEDVSYCTLGTKAGVVPENVSACRYRSLCGT
jgi:hypothetical protein